MTHLDRIIILRANEQTATVRAAFRPRCVVCKRVPRIGKVIAVCAKCWATEAKAGRQ